MTPSSPKPLLRQRLPGPFAGRDLVPLTPVSIFHSAENAQRDLAKTFESLSGTAAAFLCGAVRGRRAWNLTPRLPATPV